MCFGFVLFSLTHLKNGAISHRWDIKLIYPGIYFIFLIKTLHVYISLYQIIP